ncbi:MAG TPA: TetR/AcrR family transcriptional regulator [Terracidiphilus sp.]|nr:TetR/AcrR family transcriptional regulator [Terracidiphilus sp.]
MNSSPVRLRDRQKQHTRAEIVRAAFELFGELGYEEVPVEMIAAKAGVSRATFFNYFPQKDCLLRDIAAARAERLRNIFSELRTGSQPCTIASVLELLLKIARENARITLHSKPLFLETIFGQASRGLLLDAREHAVTAMADALSVVLGKKKPCRLLAETLFAVFVATMLEWLMRDNVPEEWLVNTVHDRLQLVLEKAA